jgi:hypothetical protein
MSISSDRRTTYRQQQQHTFCHAKEKKEKTIEDERTYRGAEGEIGLAPVEEDGPGEEGVGGEAAGERVEQRGLAGAGRAHERGDGAGLGVPREALQHGLRVAGAERDGHGEVAPRQARRHVPDEDPARRRRRPVAPQRLAERAQQHGRRRRRRRVLIQLRLRRHGLPPRHPARPLPPCCCFLTMHLVRFGGTRTYGDRRAGSRQVASAVSLPGPQEWLR